MTAKTKTTARKKPRTKYVTVLEHNRLRRLLDDRRIELNEVQARLAELLDYRMQVRDAQAEAMTATVNARAALDQVEKCNEHVRTMAAHVERLVREKHGQPPAANPG
jgi:hypothetical protein